MSDHCGLPEIAPAPWIADRDDLSVRVDEEDDARASSKIGANLLFNIC